MTVPDAKQIDAVAWAIIGQLHSHVPEADRPMSWSDFNEVQTVRLRAAAVAAIVAFKESVPPLVMSVASGKLDDETIAGIKRWIDMRDNGDFKSIIFSGPDPVYVLMADLDGTVRSTADTAVGWTTDKARALMHLTTGDGGYSHAVIICDEGEPGRCDFVDTKATRFACREDLE